MSNIKNLNNNWNLNLLNIIKLSYCFSMETIMVRIIKKNLIILKILKKTNFINDFKFIKDDVIIIYLMYKNNKKIWNNLKITYKTSHHIYINTYLLQRFYKYEYKKLLFISTTWGIISHIEALKKNVGGRLYFILY